MPLAAAKGLDLVIGGPYSSGVLAGGAHFEYGPVPSAVANKLQKLKILAARYAVPIKAAALQFCPANPAVASVIPGASKPGRIAEDHAAIAAKIPNDFWHEARKEGIVAPTAPLPIDK